MIKKVSNINLVPEDVQELLLPETGEYVPIGKSIYEVYPFSIEQYLKLLAFYSKYFTVYNKFFSNENIDKLSNSEFIGELAKIMISENVLPEFFELFPDIEEDANTITFQQLQYLLGIIYKLNFLVKKKTTNDLQTQMAIQKTMEMMGLQFLNTMEN